MPRPGYDNAGKNVVGEQATSPKPEGSSFGIRALLANTTLTFGINNIGDVLPSLSVDNVQGSYDNGETNAIQRFFYVAIEKPF
jgi:hypothetical protein